MEFLNVICCYGVFVDYFVLGLKEFCIVDVVVCGLYGCYLCIVGYLFVDVW